MSDKTIFHIDKEYEELLQLIDDQDGEITAIQEEQLRELQDSLESKVRNMVNIVKREEANQDIINDEIKRLTAIKKSSERKTQNIKSIIGWLLHKYGTPTKSGSLIIDLVDVKVLTRNTPVVVYDDARAFSLFEEICRGTVSEDKLDYAKDYYSAELKVNVPANRIKDVVDQLQYLEIVDSYIKPKVNKVVLKDRFKKGEEDEITNYLESYISHSESVIIK